MKPIHFALSVLLFASFSAHASSPWILGAAVVRCENEEWTPLELRERESYRIVPLSGPFPSTEEMIFDRISENMIEFSDRLRALPRNAIVADGNFDNGSLEDLPWGCEGKWATRIIPGDGSTPPRIFENRDLMLAIPARYKAWIRLRTLAALMTPNSESLTTALSSALTGTLQVSYVKRDWPKVTKDIGLTRMEWLALPLEYRNAGLFFGIDRLDSKVHARFLGLTFSSYESDSSVSCETKLPKLPEATREDFFRFCHYSFEGAIREAGRPLSTSKKGLEVLELPATLSLYGSPTMAGGISSKTPFPIHFSTPVAGHTDWRTYWIDWTNKEPDAYAMSAIFDQDVTRTYPGLPVIQVEHPLEESNFQYKLDYSLYGNPTKTPTENFNFRKSKAIRMGDNFVIQDTGKIELTHSSLNHQLKFRVAASDDNKPIPVNLGDFLSSQSFFKSDCGLLSEIEGALTSGARPTLSEMTCRGKVHFPTTRFPKDYDGEWTYKSSPSTSGSGNFEWVTFADAPELPFPSGFEWPIVLDLANAHPKLYSIDSAGGVNGNYERFIFRLFGGAFSSSGYSWNNWKFFKQALPDGSTSPVLEVSLTFPEAPESKTINVPGTGRFGIDLSKLKAKLFPRTELNSIEFTGDIDRKLSLTCEGGNGKPVSAEAHSRANFVYTQKLGLQFEKESNLCP